MNCSYQCDFATDHLGMRIASRDALAPTKDISCLSIWWRDWFRSDPIAVRYLVRISKVWYKYHGVFSLRISNSIPTPLLQLPTICRVLIVLLLLKSQSSSGDEQLAPSTLSCKDFATRPSNHEGPPTSPPSWSLRRSGPRLTPGHAAKCDGWGLKCYFDIR